MAGIDFPDVARGDADKFSEASVGVDADDLQVLANMRLAHAAGRQWPQFTCISALTKSPGFDDSTSSPTFSITPQNSCPKVMAGVIREADQRSQPINVEVGAANGRGANANQNVRGAERWNGDGFELRAVFRTHFAQRLHRRVRLRR